MLRNRPFRARWGAGLLCCLALGLSGAAADPSASGSSASPPPAGAPAVVDDAELDARLRAHYTETERVRLVLLPTTVLDRRGRPVRGLGAEDFRLFEDRVPQEIKYFSSETSEPVSIAFLLDVSGSMRQLDKLRHAKEAIRYFVQRLKPGDRFGLICFADRQVTWVTEFTKDRARFLERLDVQQAYGRTGLNDAVAAAPRLVDEKIQGRKAIVLITDGVDNSSKLSLWNAVWNARRVDVPVYTVGLMSVPQEALPRRVTETNLEVLRRVAEETGGRLYAVDDPIDLKDSVLELLSELRFQYLLGYYPTAQADGTFRRIRVEVERNRLAARTRSGYYAAP